MKTVVVTGASSGIGKSIAEYFSSKGWRVCLLARRKVALDALAQTLANESHVIPCDLNSPDSINAAAASLMRFDFEIDALINNAGIFRPATMDEDTDSCWSKHFATNLMGPVRLTRALWPTLKKQKHGAIVNISSTLAIRPIPGTGAYSALKAALSNWTQSLALEGAAFGIRANVISPGIVDTPIHGFHGSADPEQQEAKAGAQGAQPLGRIGQPQDIAGMVWLLASDESPWTTGADVPIDGGILLNS